MELCIFHWNSQCLLLMILNFSWFFCFEFIETPIHFIMKNTGLMNFLVSFRNKQNHQLTLLLNFHTVKALINRYYSMKKCYKIEENISHLWNLNDGMLNDMVKHISLADYENSRKFNQKGNDFRYGCFEATLFVFYPINHAHILYYP